MAKKKRAPWPPRFNEEPKLARPDYRYHAKPCEMCARLYCPCVPGTVWEVIRDVH